IENSSRARPSARCGRSPNRRGRAPARGGRRRPRRARGILHGRTSFLRRPKPAKVRSRPFWSPLLSRLETHVAPAREAKESAKRVFSKSFGCQMNVYDSQRMADVAAGEGYAETSEIAEADLVILNTCHIRERASEKIYSELGKIRELKQERAAA